MLSQIHSCSLLGIEGQIVTVEIDVLNGLPSYVLVGLPDTGVKESKERVYSALKNSGYHYEVASKENSLYVPKDSELVTTLMEAYRKVTGDTESQPMSSGGATYSRTMNNCVAFGCLLPDQEDTMHQANECLELSNLEIWLKICLEAIYQLAK